MRQYEFISVMTPPSSSGTIGFQFQTLDASVNYTYTIPCTGILSTDGEKETARKIYTCINSFLQNTLITNDNLLPPGVNAIFNIPVYGNQDPVGNFRPAYTDHVVSMFSQAQFKYSITSNNTGANIKISTAPMLVTLAEALNYGAFTGQNFQDEFGVAYTTDQIITLVEIASIEITEILQNYIVNACYVHEEDGYFTDGIQLKKYPIRTCDTPRVRRPSILQTLVADSTTMDILTKYIVNRETGWLTFRFSQNLIFNYEPFDYYNEIKVSYIGGEDVIPTSIKVATTQISVYAGTVIDIKSFRTGTTAFVYRDRVEIFKDILSKSKKYMRSSEF